MDQRLVFSSPVIEVFYQGVLVGHIHRPDGNAAPRWRYEPVNNTDTSLPVILRALNTAPDFVALQEGLLRYLDRDLSNG